jgi:hypothetical protein
MTIPSISTAITAVAVVEELTPFVDRLCGVQPFGATFSRV